MAPLLRPTAPRGAKRFAVRSCATDAFILMLDDFSYEVNGEGGSIAIRGYNVYRDGVQLNSEPVEENSYTDSDVSGTYHKYVVICSLRPRPVGPVERGKARICRASTAARPRSA